jgi:superfamily II DNA or RNA helicase
MFSVSDIKEESYPAAFRKGKDLYETGGVSDLTYEIYEENGFPVADLSAKVRGIQQNFYHVTAVIDEEFSDVSQINCDCEAFYNYDGMCKHCVAALLAYVNRRQAREILAAKQTEEELPKSALPAFAMMKTASGFKNILSQYAMRADSIYLIPESIRGKVELEPLFKLSYGYATVEFKIGTETKYVLKSISSFLYAIERNEKVRYGKKLDFYHNQEAFTDRALRWISFLEEQDRDKKRQSQYHAYYAHTGGYERIMELDEVGIDRFFEAAGADPFPAEMGYGTQSVYQFAPEEKKPQLTIRSGSAGAFLILEDLHTIKGSERYYFYDDEGIIYHSTKALRREAGAFFDYIEHQTGGECYVAAEELPVFCRDLLPLLRKNFIVLSAGFDESLYVPKKPEFELYLDKQDANVVGAKLMAVYGQEKYNVLEKIASGEVRDLPEEMRIRNMVDPYFNGYGMGDTVFVLSHDEDLLYQLLSGGLQRLSEYMAIFTSDSFRGMKVVAAPAVTVGVSLKSDLLELSLHSDEMSAEELAYLLSKYDRKKKYVRLKNGDFLDIRDDDLGLLAEVSEDLRLSESNLKKGRINVPKYRAMYLDAALKDNSVLTIEKNRDFKGMVRNMKTIEDSDYEVPDSLKGIMRGYQKTGFRWLKTLRENGFGGILADDMGLGKTLQVISLLLSEQEESNAGQKERKCSLIVCPASLVYNWQKEIERFAPALPARIIAGNAPEREEKIKACRPGDIVITSYDLLKRDADLYQDMVFAIQVIDEAQYIKNPATQAAKGVKKITAAFRLALTGTPIENRLSELWSIFDYLMPGFLYSYQRFREEIESPIVANHDENKTTRLKRMIRPFILRRLKQDVLRDLPEKLEENVYAKLEGEQLALYDAHVQHLKQMLEGQSDEEFRSGKIQILAEITKLRQICCDPTLLLEDYQGESAKTDMCVELIVNAVGAGHKVLLFSQFTSMLDRLAERLRKEDIPFYMLTGAVGKEKRMQMVESFNSDDVPVFCISLKAGGTGLNLTAADIVIHYDPWWNVAVQNQATDRAHRIGQTNVVTVYKLVTEGTIEEKIISVQERKQALAREVLEGEGMDSSSFSREELLALLS